MDAFNNVTQLWEFSQSQNLSQLGDDDFFALLQKQFPPSDTGVNPPPLLPVETPSFPDGINPQTLSQYAVPELTPTSEDSSPSPSSMNEARSRRLSTVDVDSPDLDDLDDPMLKRKAGDEDMDDGPSQKNLHTASNSKKSSSRRKSGPGQDETRLMKRKEQNRAAQRAFRERKEKHVKDLEDKVAALESRNDQTLSENENLRDLLQRLQNENMVLKQAQFTFSMAKPTSGAQDAFNGQLASNTGAQSLNLFSPKAVDVSGPLTNGPTSPQHQTFDNVMDWSSTTFNLNLIDESPKLPQTGERRPMNVDFGGNSFGGMANGKTPYTTIASNPTFMSFADYPDTPPQQNGLSNMNGNMNGFTNGPVNGAMNGNIPASMNGNNPGMNGPGNVVNPFMNAAMNGNASGSGSPLNAGSPSNSSNGSFNFDFRSLGAWPSSPPETSAPPPQGMTSLDEMFGGSLGSSSQALMDFQVLLRASPSSISPVSHHRSPTLSSGSSPGSSGSGSAASPFNKDTPPSDPEPMNTPLIPSGVPAGSFVAGVPLVPGTCNTERECPRSKEEAERFIQDTGPSVFAGNGAQPAPITSLRRQQDNNQGGPVVICEGASFPRTEKSDKNVEVLSAWRSIIQNPRFKDVDINELCTEFTSKAKCDGTKVVLDPQGVHHILQKLATHQQQSR